MPNRRSDSMVGAKTVLSSQFYKKSKELRDLSKVVASDTL